MAVLAGGISAWAVPAEASNSGSSSPPSAPIKTNIPARHATAKLEGTGVGEILKMVDAKVDPEVIKAYVENSSTPYNPTADAVIALKERGVSPDILVAMYQRGGELRAQAAQRGIAQVTPQPTPAASAPVATIPTPAPAQPIYPEAAAGYAPYTYSYPVYSYGYPDYSYYYWYRYNYPSFYWWPSSYWGWWSDCNHGPHHRYGYCPPNGRGPGYGGRPGPPGGRGGARQPPALLPPGGPPRRQELIPNSRGTLISSGNMGVRPIARPTQGAGMRPVGNFGGGRAISIASGGGGPRSTGGFGGGVRGGRGR